jgi:hypothetical protein
MKGKNFIIPLVIYPFSVMVSIAEEDGVLKKKLESLGVDMSQIPLTHSETQRGRCIIFGGNQTLIRIYRPVKTSEDYGSLQHEIFHATEFILDRVGMSLCKKSDEAYAYLIGYLTTEIYKKLK